MTTLEIILTFIVSIVTVFAGSQSILFFKQTKRLKALENKEKEQDIDAKASDGWQELVAELKEEKAEMAGEKSELEKLVSDYRDKYYKAREEKEELKIQNIKLTMTHCEVVSCENRRPPTGY